MQGMFVWLKFLGCEIRFVKVQIPCHNHNLKPTLADYIYRICYKNAKKANPIKRICPYRNVVSQLYITQRFTGREVRAVLCESHVRHHDLHRDASRRSRRQSPLTRLRHKCETIRLSCLLFRVRPHEARLDR